MWKRFEDEKPPREVDVLVVSADGRMWVGCFCDLETCSEMHYQNDVYEPCYIPDPECWMDLPSPPI